MYHDVMAIMGHLGWLKHCNAHNFVYRYIFPVGKEKKLKKLISQVE
ncbi:MAG: hypothetical protein PHD60_09080 [Clostridia bacterium]|nr:hypothetical protein [Clostridia bacterium]